MRLFESAHQAPLFLMFLLAGFFLGAVYDFLSVFRKNKALTVISDVFFVVIFAFLTGAVAFFYNSEEMHLYFYLGEICGIILEHKTLGVFIKIFMDFLSKILYNLSRIKK